MFVTLFPLKFNIFYFDKIFVLTYNRLRMDLYSFSKLDPDPLSPK
jgi:hypothetical protein